MAIDFTAACRWRRRLVLAASAVLVAGGLLLPVGGSAVAQQSACPSSDGGRAPSQVSAADRATILQLHNQYRNEVGVPPLAWDDSLADAAQRWADIAAPVRAVCHDPKRPNDQGESVAFAPSVAQGVMAWYGEKSLYDRKPEPVNHQTGNWRPWGHYSQMVWSSTQRVGCGQAVSTGFPGNILLVCRYSPPGNYDNEYPYPPRAGGQSPGQPPGRSPGPPPGQPSGSPAGTASVSQALTLVNQERAKAGCASLQVVPKLQALAEKQSRDQAARDRSGSDGADGSTSNSRLSGLGYSRSGENVAWFEGDQAPSAQKAVNAWAGNANMRNCAFKETGLAVARSNSGKFYWTQTFGG
ncbi:MAG TPA: CAP domain-containing protein [Pseudonocardiaceae bacterium]|nr:CAP domain-containing protein [Pseudonocardiaceae bacterium]